MSTIAQQISKERALAEAPPAPAVDRESENAMYAARARARELGLVLPEYIVLWVHAPDGDVLAQTIVRPSESHVRVYLRDDLGPRGTYETMLHELQHVADAPRFDELTPAERERRAEAFVAGACRGGHVFPDRGRRGREWRNQHMSCDYERFIASSPMSEARKAESRRLHAPYHAACGAAGRPPVDPDFWIRERFKLHREAAARDAATRRNGHTR